MKRWVIVGTGPAGVEAALEARRRDAEAEITIISEETERPISRTALMYVLCGQLDAGGISPWAPDLFPGASIRFLRARVKSLGNHVVGLHDGTTVPFDRLVLATGSVARSPPWPGADARGVGTFVTAQDLDWLAGELHGDAPRFPPLGTKDTPYRRREVRGGRAESPVVIGGGLIGIEVVETLLAAKRRPVFLLRDDAFWPIALDETESKWIVHRLREHGVDVRTQSNVSSITANEEGIQGIETDAGSIPCDLCIVAIGVRPNTAWLAGTIDLDEASGGIRVDEGLRTSAPNVFAAGDCAAVPQPDGKHRPELLWYTGRDQGRAAGRALAGDRRAVYRRGVAYNAAKLMDVEYMTAGNCEGTPAWRHQERGAVRSLLRIHTDPDSRVTGLSSLGRRWEVSTFVRWIEEGRSLTWVRTHLRAASFDTEWVPAWTEGS